MQPKIKQNKTRLMAIKNNEKFKNNAAQAMASVQQLTSLLPKKVGKKHKKSFLGKIGNFLLGGLHKAVSIAPAILPYLANNVPDGWQHGGNTKDMLHKAIAMNSYPQNGGTSIPLASAPMIPNGAFQMKFKEATHAKFGSGQRIMCGDYLDDLTFASQTLGQSVLSVLLNPTYWDNTRIAQFCPLFERFTINSLSLMYLPTSAATNSGGLIGWFDYDPMDVTQTGRDVVVQAYGTPGFGTSAVWQPFIAHFIPDPEQPDYYLTANGSDGRLIAPGTMRVNTTTLLANLGEPAGSFVIIYDISLFKPNLDTQRTTVGAVAQGAGGSAFTAALPFGSISSWAWDADNTLSITYGSTGTASFFRGFPNTVGIPFSYVAYWQFVGTVLSAQTVALDQVTTVSGAATIINSAATAMWGFIKFQTDVTDPTAAVGLRISLTGTTVTSGNIQVFRVPYGFQSTKKLTLQDYELITAEMAKRLGVVEKLLLTGMDEEGERAFREAYEEANECAETGSCATANLKSLENQNNITRMSGAKFDQPGGSPKSKGADSYSNTGSPGQIRSVALPNIRHQLTVGH